METPMKTTWIVVADAHRARFLQVADRKQHLVEIAALVNPKGRMDERELITDAHPRRRPVRSGVTGSDREEPSAAEHETELFAKEIARALDKARTQHSYERLHLVAPPKFLGLLRGNLDKEVQKLVEDELNENLSWLNVRELERHLVRDSERAP